MQTSDLFSYLSAFVTIVLALGLGDMIQSLHRLLDARRRVRWGVLPLVSAVLVFILVVSEFFSLTLTFGITRITYFGVVGLLAVPTLTALAAFSVLPDHVPDEGLDLGDFYQRNRRYLFAVLALATTADFARLLATYAARHGGRLPMTLDFWGFNAGLTLALLGVYALVAFVADRRAQAAGLALLFTAYMFGVSGWSVEAAAPDRPAAAATSPHS
ncbi:MAG: hypothetical protein JWP35_622 [Caulobacter sp.]|nr:hypothetical protein [Caulobacter sp.]